MQHLELMFLICDVGCAVCDVGCAVYDVSVICSAFVFRGFLLGLLVPLRCWHYLPS